MRLLVHNPDLAEERATYLSQQKHWASQTSHPWMLIDAYRGWLLADAGQAAAAADQLQSAMDKCVAHNQPMLGWMGNCLHALAISLQLDVSLPDYDAQSCSAYPAALLPQLAGANSNSQRLQLLQQLLPFNFH